MPSSEINRRLEIEYTEQDRSNYPEKPIVVDVVKAHEGIIDKKPLVDYQDDGSAVFRHPELKSKIGEEVIEIPRYQVYDTLLASFSSLNTALSAVANSPIIEGSISLREQFDEEFRRFTELASEAYMSNRPYTQYGSYVFNPTDLSLYQVLPEKWMNIGLLTSNSKLLTDPEGSMTWQEIQNTLQHKVVGFAGVSVGGGIIEALGRIGRLKATKMADPDTLSIQNLNRAERANISQLSRARSHRLDWRNPFDMPLCNKARFMANSQHMVDPYQTIYVYDEGISETNVHTFLKGNSKEPSIDVLVEEVDDPRWKYDLRKLARSHGIPVLMMSDFGHRVQAQFQDFRNNTDLPIGYRITDEELERRYQRMMNSGSIEDRWKFVDGLCGAEYRTDTKDEFARWIRNEGEQPTASLPQLGSTAMVSGGIGGEILGHYFLGHTIPERTIWDLKKNTVT